MKIDDCVYGSENIEEPVLIDLINSEPLQRLKELNQYGMPDEYYHKRNFSRYDHSVGVMILLTRFGASLEERIAGLLHDVSHLAFSHVVDWVFGDPIKEDYQDNNHLDFIENSEIPQILKGFLVDYKYISHHKNFSLLEREIPDLCADRVDYSLREMTMDGLNVNNYSLNLLNRDGQIVFLDEKIAEQFARMFLILNNNHWAGAEARMRYYVLSEVLKRSIKTKIISKDDFYKTDQEIIDLLRIEGDKEIQNNLDILRGGFCALEVNDGGVLLPKKFRYIDPAVNCNGFIKKLSEISREFKDLLEVEKEKSKQERRFIIEWNN